ncbi:MAG: hypothetical protein JXA77_09255 [Bacteroidales bacterium]|nr:hypothetical protein [Bacteroidales bacterium]MBN2818716.1 hypothetical protein [Bacteroidales bacterium]
MQRFARQITSGYLSLYRLKLTKNEQIYTYGNPKGFAFVIKRDTSYFSLSEQEIVIERKRDYATYFKHIPIYSKRTFSKMSKEYIGIINYLCFDYQDIRKEIPETKFTERDIQYIVQKYNYYKSNDPRLATIKKPQQASAELCAGVSLPVGIVEDNRSGGVTCLPGRLIGFNAYYYLPKKPLAIGASINFNKNNTIDVDRYGIYSFRNYGVSIKGYNDFKNIRAYASGTLGYNITKFHIPAISYYLLCKENLMYKFEMGANYKKLGLGVNFQGISPKFNDYRVEGKNIHITNIYLMFSL